MTLLQWSQGDAFFFNLASKTGESGRIFVHDRGYERGVGDAQCRGDVSGGSSSARGDDRNGDRFADFPREFQIEAGSLAVLTNRRQKDLSGSALASLHGPGDCLRPGGDAAAVGVDDTVAGVNGDYHRLGSEARGDGGNE